MFARLTRCIPAIKSTHITPARFFALKNVESADEITATMKSAGDKLILIKWMASWCGPCKAFGPTYSKLANQFPDITFIKADVDEIDPEEIEGFPAISSVPTFFIVRDGKVVRTFQGANEALLVEAIKTH